MKRIIILTILAAFGLQGGAAAQGTGLLASAASNGNLCKSIDFLV